MAAIDIVDTKICKAPKPHDGKKEMWKHFKTGRLGHVGAVSADLKMMMKVVEEMSQPIDHVHMDMTKDQVGLNTDCGS